MANPGRTLIVCTRHSNGVYALVIANDLDAEDPYVVRMQFPTEPPAAFLEPGEKWPNTGGTEVYLHRWNLS